MGLDHLQLSLTLALDLIRDTGCRKTVAQAYRTGSTDGSEGHRRKDGEHLPMSSPVAHAHSADRHGIPAEVHL
jgi:hypothetical protein